MDVLAREQKSQCPAASLASSVARPLLLGLIRYAWEGDLKQNILLSGHCMIFIDFVVCRICWTFKKNMYNLINFRVTAFAKSYYAE